MRVLVVGAGICGLAAARVLVEGGETVRLVEASDHLGGKIRTEREDGFIVEGGPDAFIALKPAASRLCKELGLEVVGTDPRHQRTFVVRGGRLLDIPGGMGGFVPTQIWPFVTTPLLSWPGKLRLALELFMPRRRDGGDESMGSFFRRRLGAEAWQWLVEPLLSGIYAGDGERLGLAATFPRYLEMERQYGSLTRATLAARRQAPQGSSGGSLFLSLKGGLVELVETLEQRITAGGGIISTGTRVQELELGATSAARLSTGELWRGDAILLCIPAYAAADLLAQRAPSLAGRLRDIPYASTATLTMAFDARTPGLSVDGYGFVVPRAEKRSILACTWTSSKWRDRAPDGSVVLRTYMGGDGLEDVLRLDDEALLQRALSEIQSLMGFRGRPARAWVHRWDRAMPQYRVDHPERVKRIDAEAAEIPGLYLAGAAYRGIGIPDCIQDGEAAAARIRGG